MQLLKSPARDENTVNASGVARAFDRNTGSFMERVIFHNRPLLLIICLAVTVALGISIRNLSLNANFQSDIPVHQPFIVNYLDNQASLEGLGNTLEIVVQANNGSILDKNYINTLQHLNDEVFLLPGVDRAYMRSLWTTDVRWLAVTSDGIAGGPVMPLNFSGTAQDGPK